MKIDLSAKRAAFANYYNAFIFDNDGDLVASAQFTDMFARWPRIKEIVAERFECEPDDVDCVETHDRNLLTVSGTVVGYYEI